MGERTFYVAVSPSARPGALDTMLAERGLVPGWGWMLFRRPPHAAARAATRLRVVEVDRESAPAWAQVVAGAYALPRATEAWIAACADVGGWHAFLALDRDTPVAAAAVWVEGDAAYLGFAGTVPEHRGKGGQSVLFAARVDRALELGATTLVTETGERRADRPQASYRNILRAGFVESHVVAHRLRLR
jgi:GNAT superfamily N-acetyltransferase